MISETYISGKWRILAASRRGKLHAHHGKYREDAYDLGEAAGCQLMAICDGAGSAPLSRVGAAVAARAAISAMKETLSTITEPVSSDQIKLALQNALKNACSSINTEAELRGLPAKQFASTMLILIHAPQSNGSAWVGLAEVGDGAIFVQKPSDQGGEPILRVYDSGDHGTSAGQTLFLTSSPVENWLGRVQTIECPHGISSILMTTDGIADDFYPYKKYAKDLVKIVDETVLSLPESEQEKALLDMTGYQQQASFDDRTILVLSHFMDEAVHDL